VVLLFANIGGDPEQEYLVDGVTKSLTTDLSRMRGMLVIGRNPAFACKGKHVDFSPKDFNAYGACQRSERIVD
jgi:TolB-like protein